MTKLLREATLSQRLSLVFAALLLACCGASAWLQLHASEQTAQETIQRLSRNLATHIAAESTLMKPDGLNADAVRELFDKLMAVNPSVEVYLLDRSGRIIAQAAPSGRLKRKRIDLAPVRRLLADGPLPIYGDDPRTNAKKVFSAAPLEADGREAGYIYVVLLGEAHDALAANIAAGGALRTTLWALALVALLGLIAGLTAFRLITRPLRELTAAVRRFEQDGGVSGEGAGALAPLPAAVRGSNDEIGVLGQTFMQMARRAAEQWRELSAQDQQRRELFANLSHDLRTPLTSLHGCLETLKVKSDVLSEPDRRHYLDVALAQSGKVGRLAQELFDLARLEYGVVQPDKESFAPADLVQDLFQKFGLAAEARRQRLVAHIPPALPMVTADLGMIERVLTNLLDNAIRHTPSGGEITVRLAPADGGGVLFEISDSGAGIPQRLRDGLFKRPLFSSSGERGGLGLMIVRRMLLLHGSDIRLLQRPGKGAVFSFRLK